MKRNHLIYSLGVFFCFLFSETLAATYTLPADLGSSPFNCSGSGSFYNCTSISISDHTRLSLTGNVTLNIAGNFSSQKNLQILNNGYVFNIVASGSISLAKDSIINANLQAGGSISLDKNIDMVGTIVAGGSLSIAKDSNFTGDITAGGNIKIDKNISIEGSIDAGGNIDIAKDSVINGDVTADGGSLTIDKNTIVNGICTPFHPQCTGVGVSNNPYAWFQLDELGGLWDGSTGEVNDEQNNAASALALGTGSGTVAVSAQVCRGVSVSLNSSEAEQFGIDSSVDIDDDVGSSGTISFWYKSNNAWVGGGDRQLMDASSAASGKYFFITLHDNGSLRFDLEDSNDGDFRLLTLPLNYAADSWHFIAVTWDFPNDRMQIYVDGSLQTSLTPNTTGTIGELETAYFGDNRGSYHPEGTDHSANGVIDEIRIYQGVLTSSDIITGMNATHDCSAQAVAEWRFDECSYTGITGEIVDTQGTYHATPYNGVDINTSGAIDNYLDETSNRHQARLVTDISLNEEWSVSVWFKTPFVTTQRYHVLGAMSGGGDLMYLDKNSNYRWGVYVPGKGTTSGSFRFGTLSAGWHHLGLVGVNSGPNGETSLYIDGTLVDSVALQATGNLHYLGTSYDGANGGSAQGFGTGLDEYIVFDEALSSAEILTIYNNQLAGNNYDASTRSAVSCSTGLDHFVIDVAGGVANTCLPFQFTVTAVDSSGETISDFENQVDISTSSGHGNFAKVAATNDPEPDPDADDNGSASQKFETADGGVVSLSLHNQHAEVLTISVSDAVEGIVSTSNTVTFSENAFTIIDNNNLVSGDDIAVAGLDHPYHITMIVQDPDSGECGVATDYDGTKNLKLWRNRTVNDTSGATPQFSAVDVPDSEPLATNLTLTFSAGESDAVLETTDIGQFTINLKDDTGTFSDEAIVGASSQQTVRPFGLAVKNLLGTNSNPAAITASEGIFATAGADFSASVSAVLWSAADDTDSDGILDSGSYNDNTVLPGFAWETSLDTLLSGYYPDTGVLGDLRRGSVSVVSIDPSEFLSGEAPINDLNYTEVGSFTLQAQLQNFMGVTGLDLLSDEIVVGRFVPAAFQISDVQQGMLEETCTTFTYVGETFDYQTAPSFKVSAINALATPTVTENYTGSWSKLDFSSYSLTTVTADSSNTLPVVHTTPAERVIQQDNGDGSFDISFGDDQYCYGDDATGACLKTAAAQLAPFTADIEITLSTIEDADDVSSTVNQVFNPLGNSLRYGRLMMQNVYGSELLDLTMPMRVQYFDGSNFQLNGDDTCSIVNTTDLVVTTSLSSTVTVANASAVAGILDIDLTATGDGNTGNVTVSADLESAAHEWLRYDWNGDGSDQDPAAVATFGIYKGDERQIYFQQTYQ